MISCPAGLSSTTVPGNLINRTAGWLQLLPAPRANAGSQGNVVLTWRGHVCAILPSVFTKMLWLGPRRADRLWEQRQTSCACVAPLCGQENACLSASKIWGALRRDPGDVWFQSLLLLLYRPHFLSCSGLAHVVKQMAGPPQTALRRKGSVVQGITVWALEFDHRGLATG